MADSKSLITPATTPASVCDDERLLVPRPAVKEEKTPKSWYKVYSPPYAILTISVIQLFAYLTVSKDQQKLLRYDPQKQTEVWRFFTYMLLHDNVFHFTLNVVIQCLFAFYLERRQGGLRVGILYFGGGATGALGAGCVRPDLVVGASAGVYALLISHLSHIILNYQSSKYKLYCCFTVIIIVSSDILYNLFHSSEKSEPVISEGAHMAGAISGFFLGLLLYKSGDKESRTKNIIAHCFGLIFVFGFIAALVFFTIQVKRCTPVNLLKVKYTYSC